MVEAVFLTLGFEPGPLIRAVASKKLEGGCEIVVFTPSFRDDRAERAWSDFNRILSMMFEAKNVNVKRIIVDLTSFPRAVRNVKSVLEEYCDRSVAICLTGGMRALVLAVYTSYLLVNWGRKPVVEVYLEGRGYSLTVPDVSRILVSELSEERGKILKLLLKRSMSSTEIATVMHKDRSTVYRHLTWLVERGLVVRDGRLYKLTMLGELLA